MTNHFSIGMSKATELTRAGKLAEATALLQSLLTPVQPSAVVPADDAVIDGTWTRLDEAAQPQPAKPAKPARAATAADKRTPLRETLRKIRAGGMPEAAAPTKGKARVPANASFDSLTHASPSGRREYKLYVPASRAAGTMPLVVMLHGCTQSPDDFAAGTGMNALAEEHGFLVAYPGQPSGANPNKCWNWFKAEDQARDHGEPALIAGIVRDILRDHPVDAAQVFVAGLSAGGAAAAIVATAYPDLFAAVGVHSGLPVGAATDIPQAFSAMRNGAPGTAVRHPMPTIVIHGLADTTVNPSNGKAVITQALKPFGPLTASTRKGLSDGGRPYHQTSYARADGTAMCEHWEIAAAGHAWAGGTSDGSFTDPLGPSASAEMVRFFLQHGRDRKNRG